LQSINDRIKELDFQDCKVRVTNVDSQTSDNNIVIQVIGEMSNKSAPHRKFVQTFVLAAQTNGYFVLNDIFRYIAEEEEEAEQEELQHESSAVTSGVQEPAPTGIASVSGHATKETVTHEPDILEVDKKLEIAIQKDDSDEEEPPHVNGTSTKVTEAADETPAAVAAVAVEDKPAEPEIIPTEEALEEETPKDHTATPAPEVKSAPMVATTPTAPPKPALPKTWAQLAGANRSTPAPAVPASTVSSTPSPAQTKSTSAAQTSAPTSATPVAESSPARQPSPADSAREGSSGGWQTAGAEHSRKASRAQTQPTVGENGRVRAYVKNVYATVDADELKSVLSQYGELAYFDVSRQKVRCQP
jgi:hypothetical protein